MVLRCFQAVILLSMKGSFLLAAAMSFTAFSQIIGPVASRGAQVESAQRQR